MPEQGFNFQELVRQLGLKNIDELPVVRALTPTVTFADAGQIGPPMLPPSAWSGDTQTTVAGERPYLQLFVRGSGGAFIEFFSVGGTAQVEFQINRDGVDPLAADPLLTILPKFETGFGTTLSEVRIGTTAIALGPVPTFASGVSFSQWSGPGFFLPSGGIFTCSNPFLAGVANFAIRWREVPAPALTPAG